MASDRAGSGHAPCTAGPPMRRTVSTAVAASAAAAAFLAGGDAAACPLCNGETAAAVRAGLFDDRFAATLLAVVAPFPLLLAIVAALDASGRR